MHLGEHVRVAFRHLRGNAVALRVLRFLRGDELRLRDGNAGLVLAPEEDRQVHLEAGEEKIGDTHRVAEHVHFGREQAEVRNAIGARSSSTCSALPVDTRACDARKTTFRIASSSSSISRVRSARNRSKYVEATCVSRSRCFCARSAPAIAASARAASVRAPRFPPSGIFWLSWTITGTVEKSTGVFQSWTISIGSSSAPAGEMELFAACARAVADFRSGFFSFASRRRAASRRGG